VRPFIDRYPRFLQNSPEFRDLQRALEPELLALWEARDGALEQLCVETASWGLPYWEKTLGIPVDTEKDLEARRGLVRARLLGVGTATREAVLALVAGFTGGEVELTEYPNEFRLKLKFGSDRILDLRALTEALREFLPAHLSVGLEFSASEAGALLRLGSTAGLGATLPGVSEAGREARAVLAVGGPPGTAAWTIPQGIPQVPGAVQAVLGLGGAVGAWTTTFPGRGTAWQSAHGTVRAGGTGGIQSTAETAAEER